MNSFTISCLLVASAASVSLNSSYQHPWMKADLDEDDRAIMRSGLDTSIVESLKELNKITNGDDLEDCDVCDKIVVFDMPEESSASEESVDETTKALDHGIPFEAIANVRPEEKLNVVIEQITEGFKTLSLHNKNIETDRIEEAQEEQQEEIEDIIDDANDEAVEIIEDADDVSDAADEVEEVFEERQDDIAEVNAKHTEKVATISKNQVVAEVTNAAIESAVIEEVIDTAIVGGDINEVIVAAHLPFPVKEPGVTDGSDEAPEEKLERMIERNDSIESVKKDPEFDVFLSSVLGGFAAIQNAPDRPAAVGNVGFSGEDLRPGFNGDDLRMRAPFDGSKMKVGAPSHVGSDMSIGQPFKGDVMTMGRPFDGSKMKVGAPSHVGSDMSIGQPFKGDVMTMGAPAFTSNDHRIGAPFKGDSLRMGAPDLAATGSIGKPYNADDLRLGNPGRPDMAVSQAILDGQARNYRDEVSTFNPSRDSIVGTGGFRPDFDGYAPEYTGPGDFKTSMVFEKPGENLVKDSNVINLRGSFESDYTGPGDFKTSMAFEKPGQDLIRANGMDGVPRSFAPKLGNVRPDMSASKMGGYKTQAPIADLLY